MVKRKGSQSTASSVNPLADARKAKQSSIESDDPESKNKRKVEPLSKADLKAKELWHRKSGAGYHLFVEYYGGQPKGVVFDDIELKELEDQALTKSSNGAVKQQGKGMSRAAKRRKKKNVSSSGNESIQDGVLDSSAVTGHICSLENIISPKLQAALTDKPECKHISKMLSTMSVALPLTLRIRHPSFPSTNLKSTAMQAIDEMNEKYSNLVRPVAYDASKNTIYQAAPGSGVSKFSLGKMSPELKALIVKATASGIMARQELGSMLPVIALAGINQLKYGSKVLDMCASPGSKTLQALEIVASSPLQPPERKQGRIVANDVHPLRIDSLKDAIERSGVASTLTERIKYTNHDASKFPTPKSGSRFDCIIADVPCSGDGTIRKDPHILPGWIPSISNSLHELQFNILKRALKLLKLNGVVAYSTCSMNPIEDEAVVAAALSWGNRFETNSVELIDWPEDALPGFKRRSGINTWRVANYRFDDITSKDGAEDDDGVDIEGAPRLQWYNSHVEACRDNMPHSCPSLWSPQKEHTIDMKLEKCTRLLPQDNDTGGFFVALIRKNREVGIVKAAK